MEWTADGGTSTLVKEDRRQVVENSTISMKLRIQRKLRQCVCLTNLESGERRIRMPNSGHVDDDTQFSAKDVFTMDGRKCRNIKDVLDFHRDGESRDLIGSALNELVEKVTVLNALEVGKSEKNVQFEN